MKLVEKIAAIARSRRPDPSKNANRPDPGWWVPLLAALIICPVLIRIEQRHLFLI